MVASMLNFYLVDLVNPECEFRRLNDPEELECYPKQLLQQISCVYLHLAKGDKDNVLPHAISSCGRYYEGQFNDLVDELRGEEERIIIELLKFDEKTKAAASEAVDAEAALGDIPDEFLDSISRYLMTDPVIVPTSSFLTMDRSVIERHILKSNNDPFNRRHLTLDMLEPDTEKKAKIDAFLKNGNPKDSKI